MERRVTERAKNGKRFLIYEHMDVHRDIRFNELGVLQALGKCLDRVRIHEAQELLDAACLLDGLIIRQ